MSYFFRLRADTELSLKIPEFEFSTIGTLLDQAQRIDRRLTFSLVHVGEFLGLKGVSHPALMVSSACVFILYVDSIPVTRASDRLASGDELLGVAVRLEEGH